MGLAALLLLPCPTKAQDPAVPPKAAVAGAVDKTSEIDKIFSNPVLRSITFTRLSDGTSGR